jgi:hypothetical protein
VEFEVVPVCPSKDIRALFGAGRDSVRFPLAVSPGGKLMEMEVVPNVGIGPIHLGMSREAVQPLVPKGSPFQVDFRGEPPTVVFVQLSKRGWATYKGIDLFDTPADEVIAEIAQLEDLDGTIYRAGRHEYYFPHLNMILWRDTVSEEEGHQGYIFDCVSLHLPGYYTRKLMNFIRSQSGHPPLPDEE